MNTDLVTILGVIAIPFSTILSFCAILLGLLSFDEKRKRKIIGNIEKILPASDHCVSRFSVWWIEGFFTLFGRKTLALRQLITIPFFTVMFAAILFIVWYGWVLIFANPDKILPRQMPASLSLALSAFIHYGFWYSLALDTLSVFLARHFIQTGLRTNFTSFKAIVQFVASLAIVFVLFTLIIFWLKYQATENLYISQGLYLEPRPEIGWMPWETLLSSLNLVENETLIIITSRGWISNYFIPQSLMFYSSLITQLTLIMLFLCFMVSKLMLKTRMLSVALVKNAGTARISAWGFIILATLIPCFIILMMMVIASFMPLLS